MTVEEGGSASARRRTIRIGLGPYAAYDPAGDQIALKALRNGEELEVLLDLPRGQGALGTR